MTDKTRNGFTVIEPAQTSKLTTFQVGKQTVRCRKEAAVAMRRLAEFLHEVEPITEDGWDGAYAYRDVRGTTGVWSEHAAGTALDWNASQHPRGGTATAGWTPVQARVIRWYLTSTATGRLFKWGADFTTTKDAMHFEIKNPTALAAYNKR